MVKGVLLGIAIIIIAGLAIYFSFFHAVNCSNLACWNQKLEKCERAKFLNDARETTWHYEIKGERDTEKGQRCMVGVRLEDIKQGSVKNLELKGKEMDCYLPVGVVIDPETNTESCKGELKEGMQSLIIERLYQYIINNVGDIGSELKGSDVVEGGGNLAPTNSTNNSS